MKKCLGTSFCCWEEATLWPKAARSIPAETFCYGACMFSCLHGPLFLCFFKNSLKCSSPVAWLEGVIRTPHFGYSVWHKLKPLTLSAQRTHLGHLNHSSAGFRSFSVAGQQPDTAGENPALRHLHPAVPAGGAVHRVLQQHSHHHTVPAHIGLNGNNKEKRKKAHARNYVFYFL